MQRRTIPPGERGRRLAATPLVSVVVASTGPRAHIEQCLDKVLPIVQAAGVELVVARQCGVDEYRELAERYPTALFMPAADDATPAQVRGVGLSATEGDVVAVLNDTDELDAAWLKQVLTPISERTDADAPRMDWVAWFAAKGVELP